MKETQINIKDNKISIHEPKEEVKDFARDYMKCLGQIKDIENELEDLEF